MLCNRRGSELPSDTPVCPRCGPATFGSGVRAAALGPAAAGSAWFASGPSSAPDVGSADGTRRRHHDREPGPPGNPRTGAARHRLRPVDPAAHPLCATGDGGARVVHGLRLPHRGHPHRHLSGSAGSGPAFQRPRPGDAVRPGARARAQGCAEPPADSLRGRVLRDPGREPDAAAPERDRLVFIRDRGRCVFVGTHGRRCGERAFVEFHHRVPYSAGGPPTVDNITLRCRAHNGYEAELFFGPGRHDAGADVVREAAAPYACNVVAIPHGRVMDDASRSGTRVTADRWPVAQRTPRL
jgi:hypothetical protein